MTKRRGRALLSFAVVTALGELVAPAIAATDLTTTHETNGVHVIPAIPAIGSAIPTGPVDVPPAPQEVPSSSPVASHCARHTEVTDEQVRDTLTSTMLRECHCLESSQRPTREQACKILVWYTAVTAAARCASPRQTCDLKISEARARNPESDASTVARKIEGILREIYAQLGEWLRNADGASPMRLAVPAEHAIASPPRHTEPYVETLLNAQILTHIVHHALRSVEPGQGPALAKLWADLKEYTGDESVGISVDQRSLGRLEGWKG